MKTKLLATLLCAAALITSAASTYAADEKKPAATPTPKTPATGTRDAQGRIWFKCPNCGNSTQNLSKHNCKTNPN